MDNPGTRGCLQATGSYPVRKTAPFAPPLCRARVPPFQRTKDHQLTNFTDLGLAAPILKALETQGYVTPTPIQAQAIPAVIAGRDLLGIAQTGTGKTAAFSLPIINRLARTTGPRKPNTTRALILSPTRELASQIADNIRAYSANTGLTVTTVFGGVSHRPQMTALARGVDIVVATPGRLLDHMGERTVRFDATEVFVLDEADQMLDLGFMPAIRRIVGALPKQRQNLFFSATMPADIGKLASELLKDPVRVAVTPVATTVERVSQHVIHVESHKKKALLAELFANPEMSRTLVFTRTKRGADRVARYLEDAGVGVASIHGNKSQSQREKALEAFRNARIRALVATDIAARGIDVDDVTHVVNYELPDVPESYVHRIGRTARAGRAGVAISFCDHEERTQLRDIERLTRQTIASEDRRNDAKLQGDKPKSQQAGRAEGDGDRRNQSRHSGRRNGKPQHRGQDGGRQAHGRPEGDRSGQGRERDTRHPQQRSAGDAQAAARPERSSEPRRHEGRPQQQQQSHQHARGPDHRRTESKPQEKRHEPADTNGNQLANVAFLKPHRRKDERGGWRQDRRGGRNEQRHSGRAGAR